MSLQVVLLVRRSELIGEQANSASHVKGYTEVQFEDVSDHNHIAPTATGLTPETIQKLVVAFSP
jgi:hypothetical protein